MKNPSCEKNNLLVCILIPIHNRKEVTRKCLSRLSECDLGAQYHIIVIDDGSNDGSSELIKNSYPCISLLQGDGSLWWTGSIRLGMQYAYSLKADFIVWLNDDCLIRPDTLRFLTNFVSRNHKSIIGGLGYEDIDSSKVSFGGKQRKYLGYKLVIPNKKNIYPCDLLSGNLVCMPTKIIDEIGYPDTEKCPHYGGDSLFLIRARNAGYSLFLDARRPVTNISAQSTSKMNANRWLLGDTSSKELFQLIFTHQSVISWRMWWFLSIEEDRLLGIFLFIIKMVKIIFTLSCISMLRLLPYSIRHSISNLKRQLSKQAAS